MNHPEDDDLHESNQPFPVAGPPIELSALSGSPQPFAAPRALVHVLDEAFELMRARGEGEEKPIITPWPDFNEQLDGGFWPGCHVLVSGTGAGKSTWALQVALHAAKEQQARVVYVSLELDESQIALRLAGELAKVPWSSLYNGKAWPEDRARAMAMRGQLAALPISIETGTAVGWPASRMAVVAEAIRKEYREGPLLFVVDFLQLVGSEPNERLDLRERIGRAAYAARDIARRYKATALLISSVAREKYASVVGFDALKDAGLAADVPDGNLVERYMFTPDSIVGLGKESGEIEYAADSVTVAIALPHDAARRTRKVVFATAKLRAGRPSWCALDFDGSRFSGTQDRGLGVLKALDRHRENGARARAADAPSVRSQHRFET